MSPPASMATLVERPLVTFNGAPMSEAMTTNLVDTRVELVLNGVSEATLRFYDADFRLLDASLKLGDELAISFPAGDSSQMTKVFSGHIMSLAADQGPNDLHELVVTAFDLGHKLARTTEPRVWANVSYNDMLGVIAQRNGLRLQADTLDGPTFIHLMQTQDDGAFLNEIAARTGASWRVVGNDLIVGEGTAEKTATWGENLRRFTTRIGGAGPIDDVRVRGWSPQAKRSHVGTAANVSERLSSAGASPSARAELYGITTATRIVSNRVTNSQEEASAVAAALRERMDSSLTQARGEVFGDPTLVPGTKLTVEGMGTQFSGVYRLTAVEHVYTAKGYVTRFQAGTRSTAGLVSALGGTSTFQGATVGIVTNNDDGQGMGRVKLKLPMLSEELETDWARVVTLGGGASRGMQITPAVNDEVLVVFEGGDLRRPVVIGGLWNGSDAPPKASSVTTASGVTKMWHFQTAAGHQLTFDESETGKEHVTILLKDSKTKLRLGVDKVELWADQQTVQLKTGQSSITLDPSNVKIEASNISLKATSGAVKIDGVTVEAAAQTSAKLTGGTTVDVQGQATASLQASGQVALKGALVKIN